MALQQKVESLKRQIDSSTFSEKQKQAMMWSIINSLYNDRNPEKLNSFIEVMSSLNHASNGSEDTYGQKTRV